MVSFVRRVAQAVTVVGTCGLVMCGAGTAHAQPAPQPSPQSLLSSLVGLDVGTLGRMVSGVLCNNHLVDYNYKSPVSSSPHPCINGPAHSDNRLNSGNFSNQGNPYHTGNISDVNGAADSGNSQNSGNFLNRGNPASSGNIANTNGSTNSGDSVMGAHADPPPGGAAPAGGLSQGAAEPPQAVRQKARGHN
ncbi:hypothetical protein [Streptomyces humicola]|nr:hypothetical protein [Streptomyces humicola]